MGWVLPALLSIITITWYSNCTVAGAIHNYYYYYYSTATLRSRSTPSYP